MKNLRRTSSLYSPYVRTMKVYDFRNGRQLAVTVALTLSRAPSLPSKRPRMPRKRVSAGIRAIGRVERQKAPGDRLRATRGKVGWRYVRQRAAPDRSKRHRQQQPRAGT